MPVRENTPERAGLRSAHPVSRPHLCVESRESAGLFAGGLAVHCRDGLAAGANGIRTIGPLVTKPPDSDVRGGPQAWIVLSRKNRHLVCGTCGSNLVSSSGESANFWFLSADSGTNPR